MSELSWMRLLEALKPEQLAMRVLFHEIPRREGKCLAELFVEPMESPISELGKLLDPKIQLSPRQRACVQIFMAASTFSAKRDVYAFSPSQAAQLFLFANDLSLEVRGKGAMALQSKPAFLKAQLEAEQIRFEVVDAAGKTITQPSILGFERAFVMNEHLELYNF